MEELVAAAKDGSLEEAFGSGTAAVISPIGSLSYKGQSYTIADGNTGAVTQDLYDTLTGIQWGRTEDPYGWSQIIC